MFGLFSPKLYNIYALFSVPEKQYNAAEFVLP